jgi:hypothetical protein
MSELVALDVSQYETQFLSCENARSVQSSGQIADVASVGGAIAKKNPTSPARDLNMSEFDPTNDPATEMSEPAAGSASTSIGGPYVDPTITPPSVSTGSEAFTPPPAKSPSKAPKIVGIGLGVALLAGGGAFAYTQLVKEKSNTPTQAVEAFYTAVAKGDGIGLAETLDPGERDILLDSVVPMVAEMNRLQFFEGADLKQIKGIEGSFTNYKATEKKLRDDLTEVTVNTGTLVTNFDPKALPLGKNLKDAFQDVLKDSKKSSTTTQLKDSPFVVHKTGSKWYVSLNYSLAEAARRDNNNNGGEQRAVPLLTNGTVPKGTATPEQAVSDMMQAMADVNVERMIELVPPSELPALQNYSDWFLPDAKEAIATADLKKNYSLTLTPKLRSESAGKGRSTVFIEDLPMKLKVDTEPFKVNFDYADSKFNAKATTSNGDDFEAKYVRGDFNSRLSLSDGTKVTAKRTKDDFTGTFDGSDGSQGRASYLKGKFNGSVNLNDGTNGLATFADGVLKASVDASDGTKGTLDFNNKTKKIDGALTFTDGSKTTLKFADECLSIVSDADEQRACGKDEILSTFFGESGSELADPRVFAQLGLDQFFPSEKKLTAEQKTTCARKLPKAKIGFSTVQIDGKWYVSPMRTMLDAVTAQMKIYEPKDIDCLRTQFDQFAKQVKDQIENQQNKVNETFDAVSNTLPTGDEPVSDPFAEDPFAEDPFASDTLPAVEDPFATPDTGALSGDTEPAMTDAELEALMKEIDSLSTEPTVEGIAPLPPDTAAP